MDGNGGMGEWDYIDSYCGSFPHSLLSTSKTLAMMQYQCLCASFWVGRGWNFDQRFRHGLFASVIGGSIPSGNQTQLRKRPVKVKKNQLQMVLFHSYVGVSENRVYFQL